MKRFGTAAIFTLTLTLAACALHQAPPPPPVKIVRDAAPKPAATPAAPTAAEILAQQPPEVQAAFREHEKGTDWRTYQTAGYTLFPYNQGAQPEVACEPLRTTDIQLQPGETITDVAMGDTERWSATPASAGDPRNPIPHLAIKPQAPGIASNLTIYTTKHIYHLLLRSRASNAMQEVEFYYPDELTKAMRDAAPSAQAETTEEADPPPDSWNDDIVKVSDFDPAQLNFAYTVSGANVPWKPIRAFDDGSRVYIEMARGMKSSSAPALLVRASNGTQMVNYRVKGKYYVVDRLFDNAILVSGVGRDQDRVTISYAGAAR